MYSSGTTIDRSVNSTAAQRNASWNGTRHATPSMPQKGVLYSAELWDWMEERKDSLRRWWWSGISFLANSEPIQREQKECEGGLYTIVGGD